MYLYRYRRKMHIFKKRNKTFTLICSPAQTSILCSTYVLNCASMPPRQFGTRQEMPVMNAGGIGSLFFLQHCFGICKPNASKEENTNTLYVCILVDTGKIIKKIVIIIIIKSDNISKTLQWQYSKVNGGAETVYH